MPIAEGLRDFGIMSYMSVRYKVVVASCAALLCGVALAHFPIDVSPESDDGLLRVGWTPIQVGICSHRPFQLFSGDADVYGIAAGLLRGRAFEPHGTQYRRERWCF